jgi:hypothetical protein
MNQIPGKKVLINYVLHKTRFIDMHTIYHGRFH